MNFLLFKGEVSTTKDLMIGQLIKSKAGRDKDKYFVIIDVNDEYVYLADGHLRRIENPKKKKIKHIQPTHEVIDIIKDKLETNQKLTNADIRKQLVLYSRETQVE